MKLKRVISPTFAEGLKPKLSKLPKASTTKGVKMPGPISSDGKLDLALQPKRNIKSSDESRSTKLAGPGSPGKCYSPNGSVNALKEKTYPIFRKIGRAHV